MSYVKLICPSCNSKHEVSNYYIRENNINSFNDLVKQLCTCLNIIKVSEITDPSDKELSENTIFNDKAFKQLNKKTYLRGNQIVFSVYNYIPMKRLNFNYLKEFHAEVLDIENFFNNEWNKKELLLKFKCQQDLKSSDYWKDKFKFVIGHNEDHDNSYIIMRALKNRDKKYINFLSKALNNILKKQKITLCRIPSSKVSKTNGCEDIIRELCKINPEFEDASQSIKRTEDIVSAHLGGKRNEELHKKTSSISDLELFNNKDVLLIDDIITTGASARAYSQLIEEKTNPKSLNLLIFGKTIDDETRH